MEKKHWIVKTKKRNQFQDVGREVLSHNTPEIPIFTPKIIQKVWILNYKNGGLRRIPIRFNLTPEKTPNWTPSNLKVCIFSSPEPKA